MKTESDIPDTSESSEQEELYEHYRITVEKGKTPLRIDKYLMSRIENSSRNRLQNACDADCILVNGKPVRSSYKVKPSDEIVIVLPEPVREFEVIPQNIPIDIIFEDEDIIIVNKPPGLVVHPAYGHYSGTLVNALAYHFQNLPQNPTMMHRPGLVHRIDKNTSGLLVIAKTELAMNALAKEFFERTIHRNYLALVWGDFKTESGTVTGNIGRNLKDRKVMDVFPDGDYGKHAVTHYEVVERFGYVTLIKCKLETGRTHQIRVHMKHIGHPIFNDNEYGGDKILKGTTFTKYKQFVENCFEMIPRQALHAATIGFIHPRSRKEIFFESKLAPDFEAVLTKWRKYSTERNKE
ncbi:MAG: RluA family pseudouridine synthase [Bacteroidetes bacterium]|nr:RluA family pseudouridine synthase [Bacteroidota bacterium]